MKLYKKIAISGIIVGIAALIILVGYIIIDYNKPALSTICINGVCKTNEITPTINDEGDKVYNISKVNFWFLGR